MSGGRAGHCKSQKGVRKPLHVKLAPHGREFWEFQNLVVSNLVVCNFYAEAPFCALLRSFAPFCALLRALVRTCVCALLRPFALLNLDFCAHLRVSASDRVQKNPRLGTPKTLSCSRQQIFRAPHLTGLWCRNPKTAQKNPWPGPSAESCRGFLLLCKFGRIWPGIFSWRILLLGEAKVPPFLGVPPFQKSTPKTISAPIDALQSTNWRGDISVYFYTKTAHWRSPIPFWGVSLYILEGANLHFGGLNCLGGAL